MESKLRVHALINFAVPHLSFTKGMVWGMLGGLAATAIMDLVLICAFWIAGIPPFTCFSLVGDTVARVFSSQALVNSVPLGAAAHYLLGPVLGAIFGAATQSLPALRIGSWKKAVLLAVLYAEIMSQPLLALTPILLGMTSSGLLLWYAGSFGMHFLWGCVLGVVWSLVKRLPAAANHQ